jgi:16S rRNA (uracil1498-N3)-methyltransferase
MAKPRIFSTFPLHGQTTLELDPSAQRHVSQVLRLKSGAPITLFDGDGSEHEAIIDSVAKRNTTVSLLQQRYISTESPLSIHLLQGISKGERMDYAIQKATETGVAAITPLFCQRTVVKLDPKRLEKRFQHWKGIAISACEQCGRGLIPQLHPPTSLQQQLSIASTTEQFVLDPNAQQRFADFSPKSNQITLLIGPEGGLNDEEIEQAAQQGYQRVQLGPRILRTETAAVAAIAIIQSLWGDL